MNDLSKDKVEFYLSIAEKISSRGTCPRLRVGAIAVKDDRILSMGYNGAPRGDPHCGCVLDASNHCIKAVHAEANVVANAAYTGVSLAGSTLFCTHMPCDKCLPLLVNAGVYRIYYVNDYTNRVNILQHKMLISIIKCENGLYIPYKF